MTDRSDQVVTIDHLRGWVEAFAASVAEHRDELTALDSAIGDSDHGSNLHRGMGAVLDALGEKPPDDAAALFKTVGMTLVSKVGGASGPLFGTFFLRLGGGLPPDGGAIDLAAFSTAFDAAVAGVVARGKAEAGDATLYDALAPAAAALHDAVEAGSTFDEALRAAAEAARSGAEATVPLQARKGRASYLGERSIGHQDPGATSMALLLESAVDPLAG